MKLLKLISNKKCFKIMLKRKDYQGNHLKELLKNKVNLNKILFNLTLKKEIKCVLVYEGKCYELVKKLPKGYITYNLYNKQRKRDVINSMLEDKNTGQDEILSGLRDAGLEDNHKVRIK